MKRDDFDSMDDFIEAALRSEPMLPVPFGFARSVEERLQVAALMERERRRFVRCFGIAGILTAAVAALMVAVFAQGNLVAAVVQNVPGALGHLDYALSVAATYGLGVAGAAAVLSGCLMCFLFLFESRWALRPVRG